MADDSDWDFEEDGEKDEWWRQSARDGMTNGEDLHFDSNEEKEDFELKYHQYLRLKEAEEKGCSMYDELETYVDSAFRQTPRSCVRVPEKFLPYPNFPLYYWDSFFEGPSALYLN